MRWTFIDGRWCPVALGTIRCHTRKGGGDGVKTYIGMGAIERVTVAGEYCARMFGSCGPNLHDYAIAFHDGEKVEA